MPRLAIVDWVLEKTDGDGTKHWRPDLPPSITKGALGKWAVLDLRDYGIDKALLYMVDRNNAIPGQGGKRIDLGDKLDLVISEQLAAALSNKLGIFVAPGQTLQEFIQGLIESSILPDETGRRRAFLLDLILMDEV